MKTIQFIVGLTCLWAVTSHAQAPVHTSSDPSNNISAGNEYFDASVSGIGEYMERLQSNDAATYKKLLPKYESLKDQRMWAFVAGGGGFAAGFSATYFSVDRSVSSTGPLFMAAVVGFVAGGSLYWLLSPGRSDYMKFINDHNRMNPKNPLKFQLGFNFDLKAPGLSLVSVF
jgi:hypothetical protein